MAKALDRGPENREIVLGILTEVLEQDAFARLVPSQALQKYQYLDKADRSFIARAVEGALECLIQIDEVINRYSKVKINKMKPFIRSLLQASVYRILYMGHVPDSVVYNEAMRMVVKRHLPGLKGFMDGVLRTISGKKENLTFGTPSLRYSIPKWVHAMWGREFGRGKAGRIVTSLLEDKSTWIRCDLHRTDRESVLVSFKTQGISVRELPFIESMITIDGYDHLGGLDASRKGWIQVQDATSAFVGEIASPEENSYIIDMCAAPRNKSLHLADKLEGTGMVETRDPTYQRTALIEENMARCGVTNMKTLVWGTLGADLSAMVKADIVIADLPRSGLEIIGRRPDIEYNMTPERLEELAGFRRGILSVVWQYAKPGGLLCYSTCTIGRLGSQDNAAWLRDRFLLTSADSTDRFGRLSQEPSLKDRWIQFLPRVHPYDGLFISVFRHAEDEIDPEGT